MQYSLEVKYLLISMANLRNNELCTHKRIFGFSRFKDGGIRCREFSWIYHNIRNYFFKELSLSLCLSVCLSLSVSLSLSHTHHTHYKIGSFDVLLFLNPHITFTVKIMDISREVNLRKLIVSIFVDQTWERSIRGFPP